ncbi:uncharacterized protein LODBEIA_P33490 [Lodderomyces beijingensis]|uniref:Uncharacterized protein n=1 Tax=Lodderomyces beijingensis TaxID=1775926 RepID=A0ABP0ZPI6_9ASCO
MSVDGQDAPTQVFFPRDLKKYLKEQDVYLIGYELSNVFIAFDCIRQKETVSSLPSDEFPGLKIFATINGSKLPQESLNFRCSLNRHPEITECNKNVVLIYFDPPNSTNLEYFSIEPILLQSVGESDNQVNNYNGNLDQKLKFYEPFRHVNPEQMFISDQIVLEKINQIYRTRIQFKNLAPSLWLVSLKKYIKVLLKLSVIPAIQMFQKVMIFLIDMINFKIHGLSLVKLSKVFRSWDLRLKQLNYFPIQFLCYYDKSILYEKNNSLVVGDLKLPVSNAHLNINNSNYINLYNSIWLISNDILLGIAVHSFIVTHQSTIFHFIDETLLKRYLYSDMVSLINWVSTKHPAGFKLNSDLGTFLGGLYAWTMHFWILRVDSMRLIVNRDLLLTILKVLCYGGGCSFLLSFLLDAINLLTFHIYGCYYCAAKLYNRQKQIIKSLFQLLRGKKYNVLRQRIDNLNNYKGVDHKDAAVNGSGFEIDQFLVGTLLFMILTFLLPTVFAFYLMFSTIHIFTLMVHNLLENLQIFLNFTPLFVCLLKLKNSRRLQGGITFKFLRYTKMGVTEIAMSNKSLTYGEIFVNFVKLFREAKTFRHSIIRNLFVGDIIFIKYDDHLKFLYLMLPEEHSETINIWKYLQ